MKILFPILVLLGFAPRAFSQTIITRPEKVGPAKPAASVPGKPILIQTRPPAPEQLKAVPTPLTTPLEPGPMIFGKTTNAYVDGLKDSNPGRRVKALYALGRLGPDAEASVPEMLKALQDETDISVRRAYLWALRQIDPYGAAQAGGR
jgi:hypothetical protein